MNQIEAPALPGIEGSPARTRFVDGETLTHDCFLIVGDPADTRSWKLPWRFSTRRKTIKALVGCVVRINAVAVADASRVHAWEQLRRLLGQHRIDLRSEPGLLQWLTAEQILDLENSGKGLLSHKTISR